MNSDRLFSAFQTFAFGLVVGLTLLLAGCNDKKDELERKVEYIAPTPDPLNLLVVGDQQLGAKAARQWKARKEGVVNVSNLSVKEFIDSGLAIDEKFDLVIYPPQFLGELAELNKILPVPREHWNSEDFNKDELLKHFRTTIARFANQPWAVPLGGSNFCLVGNRSQLETAKVSFPEMWADLPGLLKQLSSSTGKEVKLDAPMAPGWAAKVFLARVAPRIRTKGRLSTVFERKTMKPVIHELGFVEALEDLKSVVSGRSLEQTPESLFELALKGESTLAMSWPMELTNEELGEAESELISFGLLPGVSEWLDPSLNVLKKRTEDEETNVELVGFDGLVASVTATCSNEYDAWDFLKWLPSKTISLVVMAGSNNSGPFRASHLGDASRWTGGSISLDVADEYADVVSANHNRAINLMFPRIRSQHRYMNVLDQAVIKYVRGEEDSAQKVLEGVRDQWETITEEIGRNRQIRALKNEAGI